MEAPFGRLVSSKRGGTLAMKMGERHRPRVSVRRGARPLFFLAPMRERSAGWRYVVVWAPSWKAPAYRFRHARRPGAPLWRFSSRAALPGNRTDELSLRPDPGGQPAPPFIRSTSSHLRQPRLATAQAVIRDDPGSGLRRPETRAPHPAPPT